MEMSFRKIVNKEKDSAGKWRVWVEVGSDEQIMLKFQENPSIAEVKEACLKAIENRKKEEQSLETL